MNLIKTHEGQNVDDHKQTASSTADHQKLTVVPQTHLFLDPECLM